MKPSHPSDPVKDRLFTFNTFGAYDFDMFHGPLNALSEATYTATYIGDNLDAKIFLSRQKTWQQRKPLVAYFAFYHADLKYILFSSIHDCFARIFSVSA
jgi:hypothetical protein